MTGTCPPPDMLQGLSERSRACIERLAIHKREEPDLSDQPPSRLAAVLVLLYEKAGALRVLLTTRSKLLRSHPGQTALPGGKVEDSDQGLFETAHREAHEEVALPLQSHDIHDICILEPFLSVSKLLVTPVIAFLSDDSILDNLRPAEGEVTRIFDHLLEAILDPSLANTEPLVSIGSEDWPYDTSYHSANDVVASSLNNAPYRMHRFRSQASPVEGLTSDILIATAEIAYGKSPTYRRYAPNQPHGFPAVCRLLAQSCIKTEDSSTSKGDVYSDQRV